MVRGIDRADIFRDDADRHGFLKKLGKLIVISKSQVYAWALMTNHVHILYKSGEKGISFVMRRLLTWYAIYFNRRYKRSGHLFENRYKSILCDEEQYLLELVRYIHLNPVRAGLVSTLKDLDRYPWCGHAVLTGSMSMDWMSTEYVLAHFGKTQVSARKKYSDFMADGFHQGQRSELTGGGLVRSQGGWSQVMGMRRRGEQENSDERILGSGEFVESLLREAEERELRQLRISRSGKTIDEIIKEECQARSVSARELQSGSRRRPVSEARAVIAFRSIEELGLATAEIARALGVATSTVSRAITRGARLKQGGFA
jgi:REP element-mobilizing transposase RayT